MNAHFFKTWVPALWLFFSSVTPVAWADCSEQEALYRRSQGLYTAGQYLLSSAHFSQLSVSSCGDLGKKAQFAYSLSMASLGEIQEALRTLSILENASEGSVQRRAQLFRAYLLPEPNSSLPETDQVRLRLWKMRFSHPDFVDLLQNARLPRDQRDQLFSIGDELNRLPKKSPWVAAGASFLLPGAGQVYAGSFQGAAIAFILNSIFLATTVELARQDFPAAAVASGMVFSVTYIGNILNAANAASRFNTNVRASQDRELRRVLFPELTP